MRNLFVTGSVLAMLVAMASMTPLSAEDREAAGPVPTKADNNNPDSDVYRASDVINLPVKNDDGAEIGRIKDLVINGTSREVLYAVVAMNDAEQKDSVYIMPWNVFQPSYGQMNAIQYTVLTIPQTVWSQAPYYSTAQWRQTPFSQWGPRVNNYYSEHNSRGRQAGSNSVTAKKPILDDDKSKNSDEKKSSGKNDDKSANQSRDEKPSTKPATNPAPEAKKPQEKPAPSETKPSAANEKNPETPKTNAPKGPAPKDPK